jgi:DNA-binding SARP family transcriptional activator
MYRLRLFGGPAVEGPDGPVTGRAVHRQPLALLALLAASPGLSRSRDKLLGYLWPERDSERARNLLSVSLHALRKALGEDAIVSAGADLRLDPRRLACDIHDFAAALDGGDPETAVSLYRGPFLDGFFIPGSTEFEQWVEEQRRHWAERFGAALERLATDAEAAGDFRTAAAWWKRLSAHDPYSARIAVRTMTALAASGDRAAALQHARVHALLLEEEFGAGPEPDVVALAERLKAAPDPAAAGALAPAAPVGHPPKSLPPPSRAAAAAAPVAPVAPPDGRRGEGRRVRAAGRLRGHPAAAAGLVVALFLVAASGTWAVWQRQPAAESLVPTRIAILPFAVLGSAEHGYLADGMVTMLSTTIDGAGDLRTVDPRALVALARRHRLEPGDAGTGGAVARQFGAGLFVLGEVMPLPGAGIRITAELYRSGRPPRRVETVTVQGPHAEVFALVDDVARRLIVLAGVDAGSVPLMHVGTRSPVALKAYLSGEIHLRAGRFDEAAEAFERAIVEDSAFALAHYRQSLAYEWGGQGPLHVAAAERARRHRSGLPEREGRLLAALIPWWEGDAAEAERLYLEVVRLYPGDVEAWLQYGEVLFHYGPLRAHPVEASNPAWEQVLEVEPDNRFALVHLARTAAGAHRLDRLRSAHAQILPLTAHDTREIEILALYALAAGDPAAEAEAHRRLAELPDRRALQAVQYLAAYSPHFDGAARLAAVLLAPERTADTRAAARALRAHLAAAAGRWSGAAAELDSMAAIDRTGAVIHRALLLAHPFAAAGEPEVEAARRAVLAWQPASAPLTWGAFTVHPSFYPALRDYLLGVLAARRGDGPAAVQHMASLLDDRPAWAAEMAHDLGAGVLAEAALAAGEPARALQELERMRLQAIPYDIAFNSPLRARARERFLHAEVLFATGADEEALRRFRAFTGYPLEVAYRAPAELRTAQLLERLGRPEEAAVHYARFAAMWGGSDPHLRPLVSGAEARLARRGIRPAG